MLVVGQENKVRREISFFQLFFFKCCDWFWISVMMQIFRSDIPSPKKNLFPHKSPTFMVETHIALLQKWKAKSIEKHQNKTRITNFGNIKITLACSPEVNT